MAFFIASYTICCYPIEEEFFFLFGDLDYLDASTSAGKVNRSAAARDVLLDPTGPGGTGRLQAALVLPGRLILIIVKGIFMLSFRVLFRMNIFMMFKAGFLCYDMSR